MTLAVRPTDMHYVYILKSEQIERTYVGHTNDVHRRLREHSQLLARRLARYMAAAGPVLGQSIFRHGSVVG